MIASFEAVLSALSIHRVGNKLLDEFYVLSDAPVTITDEFLNKLLMQYFLSPFEKVNEVYRFMHSSELTLNELFHFCTEVFDNPHRFHEVSEQITKFLFEQTNHPKIKAGELYIALFKDVQIEGDLLDAIGIFKSENKETYLKVYPDTGGFNLEYESDGININKLDKGCLVFKENRAEGYVVCVVDATNKQQDAQYWVTDFLQVTPYADSYHNTDKAMGMCKLFISNEMQEKFVVNKSDQIDMLSRSMDYFKTKEQFSLQEFTDEVIHHP